jgi:hypothetical protein
VNVFLSSFHSHCTESGASLTTLLLEVSAPRAASSLMNGRQRTATMMFSRSPPLALRDLAEAKSEGL